MRKDLLFENQLLKSKFGKKQQRSLVQQCSGTGMCVAKGIEQTTNFAVKNTFALESNI